MICHECLMQGAPRTAATGVCRFCFVGLCKAHLVELYRDAPTVPQLTCRHAPARAPEVRGWSSPAPAARAVAPDAGAIGAEPRGNGEGPPRLVPGPAPA